MANSRVLLDVTDTEIDIGDKPVWMSFSKIKTKSLYDFKNLIIDKFNLSERKFNLYLNNYILLENEDIGIFQKGDIVKLKYEENMLLDKQTVKSRNSKSSLKIKKQKENKPPKPYGLRSSSYAVTNLSDKIKKEEENKFIWQPNQFLLPSSSYTGTYLSNKKKIFNKIREKRAINRCIDLTVSPEPTSSTSTANHLGLENVPMKEHAVNMCIDLTVSPVPIPSTSTANHLSLANLPLKEHDVNRCIDLTASPGLTPSISTENHLGLGNVPLSEQKVDFEKQDIYNSLIELNDLALVSNNETFECPVCFTDIVPGEGAVLKDCLHNFCMDCLRGAIQHSDTVEVRCPFQNENYTCDSYLQEQEIRSLVTPEVYDNHLQRCITYAESQALNSFHCKKPDCPGWYIIEGDRNYFLCSVCFSINCLTCAAIHHGQTCKEYKDTLLSAAATEEAKITSEKLQDMVKRGEAMHCPQCQVIIQKIEGCDFLTCTMCQTGICWVTKGPRWGPKGTGDTSGGCQCKLDGKKCHPDCRNCH